MIVDMKDIPKLRIDEATTTAWWVFADGREEAATCDVRKGSVRIPGSIRLFDVWNTSVRTPTGARIVYLVITGTTAAWARGVEEEVRRWFAVAYDRDLEVVS